MCTILYYMTLSLYRHNHSVTYKAVFILFASVNALFCSTWDLAMDWSLLDPYARHRFLRQNLAFKSTWSYYIAMVIDPIIRFNWILYAIYTTNPEWSPLVSFFVGFTEVCRRGLWAVFRVENEHCANVGKYRAYRDAPLPYAPSDTSVTASGDEGAHDPHLHAAANLEHGGIAPEQDPAMTGARQRAAVAAHETPEERRARKQRSPDSPAARVLSRAGTLIHFAHTQDFERRKKPDSNGAGRSDEAGNGYDDDDDSEDEGSDTDLEEAQLARARAAKK
jgi:xenotropic and polytropic retrovirus receptor 1